MRQRYDKEQARQLLVDMPMVELMNLAHAHLVRRFGDSTVTFVVDTNPNYTNVCVTGCRFCAFYRKPGDVDAYLLSPREIAGSAQTAAAKGCHHGSAARRASSRGWTDRLAGLYQRHSGRVPPGAHPPVQPGGNRLHGRKRALQHFRRAIHLVECRYTDDSHRLSVQ